ncbi:hypothetical protein THAOC_00182, partial [Thalassiosira oceanica]
MKFYYALSASSFLFVPFHAAVAKRKTNRFVARNGIREDKREMHKQRKLQALDALDVNMSIDTVFKTPGSVDGWGAGAGAIPDESADANPGPDESADASAHDAIPDGGPHVETNRQTNSGPDAHAHVGGPHVETNRQTNSGPDAHATCPTSRPTSKPTP